MAYALGDFISIIYILYYTCILRLSIVYWIPALGAV